MNLFCSEGTAWVGDGRVRTAVELLTFYTGVGEINAWQKVASFVQPRRDTSDLSGYSISVAEKERRKRAAWAYQWEP